jgi:uncharacterized protein YifN (PemK superfamily)
MRIVFKGNDEGNELGITQHTDIVDAFIPSFKKEKHEVFINRKFASQPDILSWRIIDIVTAEGKVEILLEPSAYPLSLATYSKGQKKVPKFYLRKFQIVDVDFGFHFDIVKSCGTKTNNNYKLSALLPGELHKRRPCIILSAEGNRVQVLPMSTKSRNGISRHHIEISSQSFSNMNRRYSDSPSFALLQMVQTVSVNRVFPPKDVHGKCEPHYSQYKLTQTDKLKIEQALSDQYSDVINNEIENLTSRLDTLNKEKKSLLEANVRIKAELTDEKIMLNEYQQSIQKIGNYFDIGTSLEEVMSKID